MSLVVSLRRITAVKALSLLRTSFSCKDARLVEGLSRYGFNLSLIEHPEIMFPDAKATRKQSLPTPIIRRCLSIIRKSVLTEALNCPKGNAALLGIGVNPFFGRYVRNFLQETAVPRIDYAIPERDGTGRRVVYSANTGKYDAPRELLFKNPDVDYLMFTNNPDLKSQTWTVVYVESELDNVLLSRDIKMSPHKYLPECYSESVYIDANATVYGDLSQLCNFLSKDVTFAVTRHCEANSVSEEIDRCCRIKGIDRNAALKQFDKYLEWGFKDDAGLAECTILIRRHNEAEVISLMEEWWQEFSNGIRRDQLSLLPCIHHQGFAHFKLLEGCVWNNQFCIIGGHRNQ